MATETVYAALWQIHMKTQKQENVLLCIISNSIWASSTVMEQALLCISYNNTSGLLWHKQGDVQGYCQAAIFDALEGRICLL